MRWPGWGRFWFAASCSLEAGYKPAIPAREVRDNVLHGPVTIHTGLIHARWADLIEKCFPLLILFLQPIQKLRFLHTNSSERCIIGLRPNGQRSASSNGDR